MLVFRYVLGSSGSTAVTDVVGAVMLTPTLPTFVSTVAWIVADPAASAVTRPLVEIEAMPGVIDVHVTVLPVRTFPFASRATAVA
jgi:hypothetical protein